MARPPKQKMDSKKDSKAVLTAKPAKEEKVATAPAKPTRASEATIDDPVRMYLMQMGRIPLLTREEEISAAVAIDKARFSFRNTMLASDFMLQGSLDLLQKVHDKTLRLDRTIEVSVTNKAEKKRIMLRLVPNLATLKHLLAENKRDFYYAVSHSNPMKKRRSAWRQLIRRRNKCVMLIEEMNLRYNKLQPLFEQLEEINSRMQVLKDCLLYTSPSPRDRC